MNMDIVVMGFIGATVTIYSSIPSLPKVSFSKKCQGYRVYHSGLGTEEFGVWSLGCRIEGIG